MSENNPIQDIIDDVNDDKKKVNDAMNEAVGESPEADHHDDHVMHNLFTIIADTIISVMQDPATVSSFKSLESKMVSMYGGDKDISKLKPEENPTDISKEIIQVISTTTTYSVVMAIQKYDQMLMEALSNDLSAYAEEMNNIMSAVSANTMNIDAIKSKLDTMDIISRIH